ncbi:hypothetical protein [Chryseobacterium sp. R2A-55]|nr:hypothetical protein [Chryseobacterium sp. R2A-55]
MFLPHNYISGLEKTDINNHSGSLFGALLFLNQNNGSENNEWF